MAKSFRNYLKVMFSDKSFVKTIVQISTLLLTIESAIFLSLGNLCMSPLVIAEISATKYDYNPDAIVSLSEQFSNTWIGVFLLMFSFILQMLMTNNYFDFKDFKTNRHGVIVSILLCLIIFFVLYWISSGIASYTQSQAELILMP